MFRNKKKLGSTSEVLLPRKDVILEAVEKAETSLCLPLDLNILTLSCVFFALGKNSEAVSKEFLFLVDDEVKKIEIRDPISLYELQFSEIFPSFPGSNVSLFHQETETTIFWDFDDNYTVLVGDRCICKTAFPFSIEIMKAHYLECMSTKESLETFTKYFEKYTKNF